MNLILISHVLLNLLSRHLLRGQQEFPLLHDAAGYTRLLALVLPTVRRSRPVPIVGTVLRYHRALHSKELLGATLLAYDPVARLNGACQDGRLLARLDSLGTMLQFDRLGVHHSRSSDRSAE